MLPVAKKQNSPDRAADSLSVEVGGWFRAHATGRGVLAVPLVVAVLVVAVVVRMTLG